MKLNVIFVFRTINSIKLQGIHFYIIDIYVSGNEGVKEKKWLSPRFSFDAIWTQIRVRDYFLTQREILFLWEIRSHRTITIRVFFEEITDFHQPEKFPGFSQNRETLDLGSPKIITDFPKNPIRGFSKTRKSASGTPKCALSHFLQL